MKNALHKKLSLAMIKNHRLPEKLSLSKTHVTFNQQVLIFFIYAVLGWCWEVIFYFLRYGELVKRGFLIGFYCPIYGFSALLVLYFFRSSKRNIILLYFFSATTITLLEYITSIALSAIFHASWWDYHDIPFNFQGRIALPISLFWGLLCILIAKYVHPIIMHMVIYLENCWGKRLSIVILSILILDFFVSVVCQMPPPLVTLN